MEHKTVSDLVRKYFSDFVSRDRKAVEELLTDNFTFHSPHDPQIGKTTYFEKCWPNGDNFRAFHIEKLFEKGNEAFVRYECETKSGGRFRNTEFIRVEGDKIKEVEVYYGSLPEGVPEE
jgi:ketosteroid isomerase-like protein